MMDMCCDRKGSVKAPKKGIAKDQPDDSQVDDLFRDNTKLPGSEDILNYKASLPRSGLSKRAVMRLKIEFKFLKHVNSLLLAGKKADALLSIESYYKI